MVEFLKKYYKLIIWCLVIFSFSSIPSAHISEFSMLDFVLRKAAHITEFFILTLISFKTFNSKKKSILFSVLYATSDEIHQRFTPGRGPSPSDVLIDTIGVVLGIIFIWKNWFVHLSPKIQKLLS